MYMKGSTLIESLFAFEIYCIAILLFVSLYASLMTRVGNSRSEYKEYYEERYDREKAIYCQNLSDLQEVLP